MIMMVFHSYEISMNYNVNLKFKNQRNQMENIGYILLGIVAICWLIAIIIGVIVAFPVGLIGLVAILGIGFLFAKVIKDRLENKEDDHYSDTVIK